VTVVPNLATQSAVPSFVLPLPHFVRKASYEQSVFSRNFSNPVRLSSVLTPSQTALPSPLSLPLLAVVFRSKVPPVFVLGVRDLKRLSRFPLSIHDPLFFFFSTLPAALAIPPPHHFFIPRFLSAALLLSFCEKPAAHILNF